MSIIQELCELCEQSHNCAQITFIVGNADDSGLHREAS